MAFTVGINKNMGQMFEDLETLMLQEGWEKLSRNTIGSFTTSRGYKYTASGLVEAYPGRYSDTTAIKLAPNGAFAHSTIGPGASETFYNDYPTEFSFSFWLNLSEDRTNFYNVANYNTRFAPQFMGQFYTGAVLRCSPTLALDKDCALGEIHGGMYSLLYIMKKHFVHKDGKGWEHFTFTYSNLTKTICFYLNGNLVYTTPFPIKFQTWTIYGAIHAIAANSQSKIIDELIMWNKVLTNEETLTLANSTTKIPADAPYVFEKFTQDIGVLYGGTYQNISTGGTPILVSILYNTSNNIEFRTPTFYSSPLKLMDDYAVAAMVGQETNPRCMAGVGATSSVLKKYWLVVNSDRVIIAYKLYDPTAARVTPVYQLGYIGKIKSLGNDGASIFSAGTTGTTTNYLWTTINATTFRSGVMYASNNAHRLGYSGYLNAAVGSINTTLSSLYSISNSTFLAGINVSYSTIALGSLDGVFVVSHNQANPEDLITINTNDYVILPDADAGAGVYNLALKLS